MNHRQKAEGLANEDVTIERLCNVITALRRCKFYLAYKDRIGETVFSLFEDKTPFVVS